MLKQGHSIKIIHKMKNEEICRQNETRRTELDVLRGVAILVVVFGHAIQASLLDGEESVLWSLVIRNFQMPLLFFISGYTAAFRFPCNSSQLFIAKKVKRLLVPYVAYENLHYILTCFVTDDLKKLRGALLIKEVFISDFWFLRALFIFYVVLWLCNILFNLFHIRNRLQPLVLIFSGLPVYLLSKNKLIGKELSIWHYMWFLMGMMVAVHGFKHLQKVQNKTACLAIAIAAAALATLIITKGGSATILTASLILLICAIVFASMDVMPKALLEYLTHVGRNTLPVYGIHWCLFFSPGFQLNWYQHVREIFPLYLSAFIISILWMVGCEFLISFLSKSGVRRKLFLGV